MPEGQIQLLFNSNNIIKWISFWFMITAVSPGLKFERNRSLKLAMIPNFISWNHIIYVYKRKLQADLLRKIYFVTDDFPQSKFYLLNRTSKMTCACYSVKWRVKHIRQTMEKNKENIFMTTKFKSLISQTLTRAKKENAKEMSMQNNSISIK